MRASLESGVIGLDPMVPYENIGPASIDLRLSDEFMVIDKEMEAREREAEKFVAAIEAAGGDSVKG